MVVINHFLLFEIIFDLAFFGSILFFANMLISSEVETPELATPPCSAHNEKQQYHFKIRKIDQDAIEICTTHHHHCYS
jgi:hypothetical protein